MAYLFQNYSYLWPRFSKFDIHGRAFPKILMASSFRTQPLWSILSKFHTHGLDLPSFFIRILLLKVVMGAYILVQSLHSSFQVIIYHLPSSILLNH